MNCDPQPLQTLFLWRLLANGGGDFSKDIKPRLVKKSRNELVQAGLIAWRSKRTHEPAAVATTSR